MADNKAFNDHSTDDAAAALKRSATDLAQSAKQTAVDVAADAQDKLKAVASDTQQTLTNVAAQAKQDAGAVVEDQKNMVADRLRTVSNSLRQTGSRLHNEDEAMIGGYAQDAAGQIDRFAGYLQNHDVGDLINDVRGIAQRQPEIFIAGSLAVGFLLGRFLKSSDAFPGGGQDNRGRNGYTDHSYRRTYLGEGYRRADYGAGAYGGAYGGAYRGAYSGGYSGGYSGDYGSAGNRGDTTYADLQYRDAMRGDARYRDEELRNQGGSYSSGVSYGVQENAAGGPARADDPARAQDPARPADRTAADRSTTGPGFSPADYGKTGYRGSASVATGETQKAAQENGKRNDAQNQDSAARGAQAS